MNYPGLTELQIYKDTIFHTFAFALLPVTKLEVAVKGSVRGADGRPLVGTDVTLVEGGTRHWTFTNTQGEFTFFGHIIGPATIESRGHY